MTLTPLAVEHDSRTFKQAASMARLGHESIVVEGQRSALGRDGLPFRLMGTRPAPAPAPGSAAPPTGRARLTRLSLDRLPPSIRRRIGGVVGQFVRVAWFLRTHGLRTARELPPASLYYLHSFQQFPAVWLRSRQQGGIPFIYDAHDFYPVIRHEWNPGHPRARIVDLFLEALERMCVRKAAEVVTVSEGVADLMERRFGRRPQVIRNSHDRRLERPPTVDLRESLGLDRGSFLVVAVGHAKPGAAIEEAIRAVADLPDSVHLAFLGRRFAEYEGLRRSLRLERRVHFVEPVQPTEVVPFVNRADAAALFYYPLTSSYENALPNGFFLSVAAGLPLLYPHRLSEIASLAEKHKLGLSIDPQDPDSIVAAIRELLADSALLERHREAALRARASLAWEIDEQRLGAMIERTLGSVP